MFFYCALIAGPFMNLGGPKSKSFWIYSRRCCMLSAGCYDQSPQQIITLKCMWLLYCHQIVFSQGVNKWLPLFFYLDTCNWTTDSKQIRFKNSHKVSYPTLQYPVIQEQPLLENAIIKNKLLLEFYIYYNRKEKKHWTF